MPKKQRGYMISVCIVAAGVFLFSAVMAMRSIRDYVTDAVRKQEEQYFSLTRSIAHNVETYIDTYTQDLVYLTKTRQFADQEKIYLETGDSNPLRVAMLRFVLSHNGYLQSMNAIDHRDDTVISTSTPGVPFFAPGQIYTGYLQATYVMPQHNRSSFRQVPGHSYQSGDTAVAIKQDNTGAYYLSILCSGGENALSYEINIRIHRIYDEVLSQVDMGDSAVVQFISEEGLILMHDFTDQIGKYAYSRADEKFPQKNYQGQRDTNFALCHGHEKMVTFPTYYEENGKVKTGNLMVVFSPAVIGDSFFQVCIEIDRDMIVKPVFFSALRQFLFAFNMLGGVMLLVFVSMIIAYNNDRMREENDLLRERNETLEKIHEQEERLSHHQRLQMLGTLASGISHEFNNLMTPIMAYSMIFLQDMTPGTEEYEEMQAIYHASEKAKGLVGQISRLSRKKTDNTFRYLLFDVVVSGAIRMVAFGTEPTDERRIEKKLGCGEAGIMGAETQLQQAFLNIMVNGLYAMRETGGILHVSTWREGPWLFARIQDEGTGMTEEIKNRIFDPFFTTKGVGEGTGLGLSLTQATIESHGGSISVESTVGEGTIFTIGLPYITPPA